MPPMPPPKHFGRGRVEPGVKQPGYWLTEKERLEAELKEINDNIHMLKQRRRYIEDQIIGLSV